MNSANEGVETENNNHSDATEEKRRKCSRKKNWVKNFSEVL